MGVYEGRGQLTKSMKDLLLKWNDTKMSWSDANSTFFEKSHLELWEADLRNAVGAMDHMAQVLAAVRRDCQ